MNAKLLKFRDKAVLSLDFLLYSSGRQRMMFIAVAAACMFSGLNFLGNYGVFFDFQEARCLPERLYLGYPRNNEIQRNDVVSFIATQESMAGLFNGERIAKLAAGLPGDKVVSDETGVTINGLKVAERNPLTLGRMLKRGAVPVSVNKTLGEDEVFLLGTLPRAFDSRYWGVFKKSRIDRMMNPVI